MTRTRSNTTPHKLSELLFLTAAAGFFVALFVVALVNHALADPPPIGWTTPVRIVRVIDGDTVEVEITRRLHVRLDQCWAPESRTTDAHEKRLGLAAKANLEALLAGRTATLYIPADRDQSISNVFTLSRVVGTIWTDDDPASVNRRQVDHGHAWTTKAAQQAAVEASR